MEESRNKEIGFHGNQKIHSLFAISDDYEAKILEMNMWPYPNLHSRQFHLGNKVESPGKLSWLAGISPCSIGNTSTHSGWIFQPVMLVFREGKSPTHVGPWNPSKQKAPFWISESVRQISRVYICSCTWNFKPFFWMGSSTLLSMVTRTHNSVSSFKHLNYSEFTHRKQEQNSQIAPKSYITKVQISWFTQCRPCPCGRRHVSSFGGWRKA